MDRARWPAGRRGATGLRAALLVAVLLAAALPACFHPEQPACAFSCVTPPYECPAGYTCQADGLCHNDQSQGTCTLDPVDGATAPEAGD